MASKKSIDPADVNNESTDVLSGEDMVAFCITFNVFMMPETFKLQEDTASSIGSSSTMDTASRSETPTQRAMKRGKRGKKKSVPKINYKFR